MSIIKEIEIDRFRSCRKVRISDVEDLNCLSGKNNSGKSNILRAISLFFTGEVEPGLPFDMARDCNSRPKEKREITITIRIVLDESIRIQKTLKSIQNFIPRDSKIKKVYEIARPGSSSFKVRYYVNDSELSIEDRPNVDTYLNLFNFRYITSDRTPKKVLEENLVELQAELKFRLSKKTSQLLVQNSLMDALKSQVHSLFSPVSSELSEADEMISSVDISVPNELTELLNSATYMIESHDGDIFNERDQGHGIQNLLLFTILYLVDKNFHRKFGWKIGTIWAIEEPETFLHFNLENQLSLYLQKIISKNKNRFQLFITTHSIVFPQYATNNYYVDKSKDKKDRYWTNCERMLMHKFLFKLGQEKITSVSSLVTMYPVNHIVLVEGEIDEYIIQMLIRTNNIANTKVFAIQKYINDSQQKGCEAMISFIDVNYHLINLRSKYGILFIFDWDVKKPTITRIKKKISSPNLVYQMSQSNGNPLYDKSFRGIELFYPTTIIEELYKKSDGLINDRGSDKMIARYYTDRNRYKLVKHKLFQIVKEKGDGLDFRFFERLIESLKEFAV